MASAWKEVREGADRVVVVRGEAGIGKSRTVHDFRTRRLPKGRSSWSVLLAPHSGDGFRPGHRDARCAGQGIRRAGKRPPSQVRSPRQPLGEHSRFGADALPLVAALLSIRGCRRNRDSRPIASATARPNPRNPAQWMAWSAERLPLAILIEDIHWADPSTLDFLDLVIQNGPGGRTLLCVTSRPEFLVRSAAAPGPNIELTRLNANEVEAIVHARGRRSRAPPLVARRIAERSEGVPLFAEEVTKTVLESGALRLDANRYELESPLDERYLPARCKARSLPASIAWAKAAASPSLGQPSGENSTTSCFAPYPGSATTISAESSTT